MAISYQKHSPLLGLVLRTLLCPSIDPRVHVDRLRCEIRLVQRRHSPSRAQDSDTTAEVECTITI
jgi:hypothetical protein